MPPLLAPHPLPNPRCLRRPRAPTPSDRQTTSLYKFLRYVARERRKFESGAMDETVRCAPPCSLCSSLTCGPLRWVLWPAGWPAGVQAGVPRLRMKAMAAAA